MSCRLARPLAVLLSACALTPLGAVAQPFAPGPMGTSVGSSTAGARVGGPLSAAPSRIEGTEVFGDTVTERSHGRPFDDSYLSPEIPDGRDARSAEERAIEGRSDLGGIGAGAYARQGAGAIGSSAVTRGRSTGPQEPIRPRRSAPAR